MLSNIIKATLAKIEMEKADESAMESEEAPTQETKSGSHHPEPAPIFRVIREERQKSSSAEGTHQSPS